MLLRFLHFIDVVVVVVVNWYHAMVVRVGTYFISLCLDWHNFTGNAAQRL